MFINKIFDSKEPYRLFFSLGLLSAISGVFIWIAFSNQFISFYPKQSHIYIMNFAMFYAFVIGFFMTAVPRMTGSANANKYEMTIGLVLILFQNVLGYFDMSFWQIIVYLMQVILLLYFLSSRILKKKKIPFEGFYFIPFAFFWSFLAFLILIKFKQREPLAYLYLVDGFLLNLICGLGSRLIPIISRLPGAILPHANTQDFHKWKYLLSAIGLNLIIGSSIFISMKAVHFMIGIYLIFHVYFFFKITSSPTQKNISLIIFRFSCFILITSKIIMGFVEFKYVEYAHLYYIIGLFLLTVAVATRVKIAHAGLDLNYEVNSLRFKLIFILFAMAGVFRWISGNNFNSLAFYTSITLFIVANLVFLQKLLKTIFFEKKEEG